MDTLSCEDMRLDLVDQRHQGCRRGAYPVGKGRHLEIDAFPA